ncbi:MAG: hypothetical protein K8H88_16830 [Sandaracinaceae bacterium]|nr:hypothetical protein [Sandaracinaceae bacterium]
MSERPEERLLAPPPTSEDADRDLSRIASALERIAVAAEQLVADKRRGRGRGIDRSESIEVSDTDRAFARKVARELGLVVVPK